MEFSIKRGSRQTAQGYRTSGHEGAWEEEGTGRSHKRSWVHHLGRTLMAEMQGSQGIQGGKEEGDISDKSTGQLHRPRQQQQQKNTRAARCCLYLVNLIYFC
jgi:hypothetical protein